MHFQEHRPPTPTVPYLSPSNRLLPSNGLFPSNRLLPLPSNQLSPSKGLSPSNGWATFLTNLCPCHHAICMGECNYWEKLLNHAFHDWFEHNNWLAGHPDPSYDFYGGATQRIEVLLQRIFKIFCCRSWWVWALPCSLWTPTPIGFLWGAHSECASADTMDFQSIVMG
jgi:hypothetical protein